MLSDYERGRAQLAIEWVARAQKPIVEVGGRPLDGCDLTALAGALDQCIFESGEDVRGFVIPDKTPGYCCYGFYRYGWALEALLSVWGPDADPPHREWLYGLLFGYDAQAIERFVRSSSSGPE